MIDLNDVGDVEALQAKMESLQRDIKIKQYEARLIEIERQQIQVMLNLQKLSNEKRDVQEHLTKLRGE